MSEHIDSRPLYRRALGRSFWLSFNALRRTWKRTSKKSERLYQDAASALHETRVAGRRTLVAVYLQSFRMVGLAKKNSKRLRRRIYHRGRYTSTGRALLAVSEVATSPRDALRRKAAVLGYNRRYPATQMGRSEGYALLAPGSLPGSDEIIALSRRLFEEKQRKVDAAAGPDSALHAKKWAFLRSVLTNQDLAAHPELVDFALSDGLLKLVTNYLGTVPHLNRIDLLYSVSHGGDEAVSSQMYHFDPEGMRQAKLFLNLRDTGPDEGPFTFIPASDSRRITRAVKQQRASDSDMAMARFLDRELAEVGGLDNAISVEGPTGSAVLVDTSRCLHCGSRVKPGTYRLCLYIQYTASREHGNVFDADRYAGDPIRYLATVNSRRSTDASVSAPHQMA
jgi:hypothetical protein